MSSESGVQSKSPKDPNVLTNRTLDFMGDFKDLIVFQKAYKLAMDIFEVTKKFPSEEKYSLTDQIRRSSRSVCTNLAEGYRKRDTRLFLYQSYPILKLKIPKRWFGWILRMIVNILLKNYIKILHLEIMKWEKSCGV